MTRRAFITGRYVLGTDNKAHDAWTEKDFELHPWYAEHAPEYQLSLEDESVLKSSYTNHLSVRANPLSREEEQQKTPVGAGAKVGGRRE